MRSLLIYIFFSVALWYLAKAVMRHYLARQHNAQADRERVAPQKSSGEHGNYESARDARFRDVE